MNTDAMPNLRAAAAELHAAGFCVLPIKADGRKAPAVSWMQHKVTRSTPDQHDTWFNGDHPRGIAVVYGAVSGAVELIEFEGLAIREGLLEEVTEIMDGSGLGEPWAAILNGWVTESPSGGRHFRVRLDGGPVPPNRKLASRLATPDEYTDEERQRVAEKPNTKVVRVLIETRGEGGYGLVEPSGGTVHASGRPYVRLAGAPGNIPVLDADIVDAIRSVCRMVCQLPKSETAKTAPRPAAPRPDGSLRPGDDYELRAAWDEILHGTFRPMVTRGNTTYWGWADGVGGVKATTGRDEHDRLFVFATGSPFLAEVPYTKFGAYALLEHASDHKAAARALAHLGYGSRHLSAVAAQPRAAAPAAAPAPGTAPAADPGSALAVVLPAEEPAEESEEAAPPEGFGYDTTFGLPRSVETPFGYRVTGRGVEVLSQSGESWNRVTFAPLAVTATFEDPEGDQYVELSWIDKSLGRPRRISRIVSRETAKRGRKLIETLGAAGLPAVEGDARAVEKWLAEFEAGNVHRIPSEQLARWLGWQDDGTFVASPEDDIKVDVQFEEQRGPARAHSAKGTLDAWKDTIGQLAAFPVPRVAVAAALAAPLLRPLGLNSFTLDISSRSTKGKTTALQCALSVWADPSEHASAMSNWRTTLYAIEKRLNLVRGLVTVFDETMAVTDDSLIDEVLYQLPMNHGKARSGGAFGNMLPWETILLSSGERPALSFTTSQGAAARILGTTIAPFGDNGGAAAAAAREGVLANHGHAGPEFIRYVLSRLALPNGRDALKQRHRQLVEEFRGGGDMTNRRAPMVAALALAETLACGTGLLPYEPLAYDTWRGLFTAHNPTDNRPEMALDVLREYVAGHAHELYSSASRFMNEQRPPFAGWLGVLSSDNGTVKVALLPERVRKVLGEAGYSLDAVVGSWVDAGYLETLKSQRPPHLVPRRFDGARAKCLAFTTAGISYGDEDDAA